MKSAFIDSNIFIRHLTADHNILSPKATQVFEKIEKRSLKVTVSILVINEVLWIMDTYYKIPRKDSIPQLLNLLSLKGIGILEIKKEKLMDMLHKLQTVSYDFTDVYLFYSAQGKEIVSFDRDFEKMKGLEK